MPLLTEAQQAFLANPFYAALTTNQTAFAERIGGAIRYRPEVLPFAAVATSNTVIQAEDLRRDTDTNFCGILPHIEADTPGALYAACLQMAWPTLEVKAPAPLPNEHELGAAEAHEMLELTRVAFPGYFRADTYKLGRYIGIRVEGELVAMAGHRTHMPGLREISGVCTRPGHTGRGYAQHLIQRLIADNGTGETPYLHTTTNNTRAIAIYQAMGFITTAEVPFLRLPQLTQQRTDA
jgi:ribosomal protein S18 acetylase RimI-like enzyme